MNYNKSVIGDNIGFSSIIDEKFNTCSLYIRFITEISRETASANSMAVSVLTASNSKLTTLAQMNERLSSLYGAHLSTSARKRGDLQILGISASWIHNRFALENEDISAEMLGLVSDCMFSPNVCGDAFDAESFKIVKNDLLDRIDGELNDKRSYALSKAAEIAFRGEPAENQCSGTKEQAEAVTAESAYKAYLELLKTAQIEIFYTAPEDDPKIAEIFRNCFEKIGRQTKKFVYNNNSPLKGSPENLTEELDVRQCKIVLNFKSDSDDVAALKLFGTIFGGTPVSKLFMNVREKLSLCYYCACRFTESKNTFTVDCGVEKANIQKACDEIIHQLDEIKNGNISDEELESAMLAIDNSYTSVGDTPASYTSWYMECLFSGKTLTPAQQLELFRAVTKDRIIRAAASVKFDSSYYMLNKETSNE